MAVDMFLELKGIDGESQDSKFGPKKASDLLAWSWGMSQSGTFHSSGGGGAGKVNVQDISVTKYVDSSSATLMHLCATGEHITEGILTVRKAGKTALEYIIIKMFKIMVTSCSTGGSGGEERLTENVSLNFAKVQFDYREQKPDGSGAAAKTFKWDMQANKAQ